MKIKAVLKKNLSVIEAADADDGLVYRVKNPQSDETFEFGEKEWFLLSSLDAVTLPAEIIEVFKLKFDAEIALEQFESLVEVATQWGLCEDETNHDDNNKNIIRVSPSTEINDEERGVNSNATRFSNILREKHGAAKSGYGASFTSKFDRQLENAHRDPDLTWKWFDPSDLFYTLSQILSPLRYMVYIVPLIVLAGILVISGNQPYFIHDLFYFRLPLNFLQVVVFSMFTVNLITQVSRGIVCRGYGMTVHSFGIRLILGLIPRFGVHTDGISRLSKRQQISVHAAPLLIRLTMFGVFSVIWAMTRSNGTQMAYASLMIATVSMVSFVLSANPLINANGYKLLTVYFNNPNLRRDAYQAFLKRPDSGREQTADDDLFALKFYAFASISFWILFIGGLFYLGAKWLEIRFHGTGMFLFLTLCVYFVLSFQRRIKKKRADRRDNLENRPGARMRERFQQRMQQQTETEDPVEYEENESNKKKPRWKKFLFALILLIVAFLPYPYETGGSFSILAVEQEWVHAETEGIIKDVPYNGNQYLEAGALIAKLSSVDQEQAVQTTSAAILEQEAKLELLLTTPRKEDLDLAEKKLETSKVQLKYSVDSEKRLKKLYKEKHVSFEDYEDERRKRDIYAMEVEEAKANLSKVKAGPHPQEIEAARSELKRLEERLKFELLQLEMTNIVMPIEGYLVTRNLKDKTGQYLNEGDMFAVVEDSSSVRVDIEIPEGDISEVAIGAAVRLKVWTYPGQIFEGKVTEIDRTVSESAFGEVVVVSAVIPNPDGVLQSGMTGFGKVDGGSEFVIVAFTHALVRFFQIELWSWIP